jgi:hypothetical protein
VLVERALPFFWVFKFVLRFFLCVLGTLLAFTGVIMFWVIAAFGAFLRGVLGAAIPGMLTVAVLITVRVMLQFQFLKQPTISLVYKILHF